jgi:hypothetical protein
LPLSGWNPGSTILLVITKSGGCGITDTRPMMKQAAELL